MKTKILFFLISVLSLTGSIQAQENKPPDAFLNETSWVNSEDGILSIRFSSDKKKYIKNEGLWFKFELRNNSDKEVVTSSADDVFGMFIPYLSIEGPNEACFNIPGKMDNIIKSTFRGPWKSMPPPKPIKLSPGEIVQKYYCLSNVFSSMEGLDVPGEYSVYIRYGSHKNISYGNYKQDPNQWEGIIKSDTVKVEIIE